MREARAHIIPLGSATVGLVSLLAVLVPVSRGAPGPLGSLGPLASLEDELADPAPAVALHPASLADVESVRCAACHLDVAREWAQTAHAIAWLDEDYQAAIGERKRPELCAACHVPSPLLVESELPRQPLARADAGEPDGEPRAHGITCTSCHVGAGDVVLGPRGDETPAHATAASPFLTDERSPELCALCHKTNIGPVVGIAKDYPGSAAAAAGTGCVDCHMRPVERRWANAENGAEDPGVPLRVGRSHALQTPRDPAFLARAFALEWRPKGDAAEVVVRNKTGHRVPGLRGRAIRFEFESPSGGKAELVLDTRTYLPVDGEQVVTIPGGGDSVHVRAEHVDPRAEAPVVFLDGDVARAE